MDFSLRRYSPLSVPIDFEWGNGVFIFSQLLWNQSSSNLQVTRTGIKARMSSNFGRIWPVILELGAFERWKKKCLQLFSVTFDWIFVELAGNEDRHKSSNELEFGPDRIIHFGVIRPWARMFFPIDSGNGENDVSTFSQLLWIQSSSNLQITRTDIKSLDGFESAGSDHSLWSYVPLTGEKDDVSSFSHSPLIRYLSNLQVKRIDIKLEWVGIWAGSD